MNSVATAESRLAQRIRAPWRGLALYLLSFPGMFLSVLLMTALSLLGSGVGLALAPFMIPPAIAAVRGLLNTYRELIARWTGERIDRPYLPVPEAARGFGGHWERFTKLMSDPATWRDLAWLMLDPIVAAFTAFLPAFLILTGIYGWVLAGGVGGVMIDHGGQDWYTFIPISGDYATDPVRLGGTVAVGTALMAIGFLFGPNLLGAYARWGRSLLGPTEKSRLALRVQHLTETRSDAVDVSAAELRRIERDLHDGAQARLVAMGMSLGAIEHLLEKDPEKAKLLLAEARQTSATALSELRDLVRGIHPPVLADRGLADAVRALALDSPLRIEVHTELPGRLEPPMESAGYFAVAEVLANAAKHSGAARVWIDLRHERGMLRISVTDDGHGGADLAAGTGLRGIERRIGTFDGVLALNSPLGGPTIVTMELPCDLTSPPA